MTLGDPIREDRSYFRRRYRHVRLTLVFELEIGQPYRWSDEARAALAQLIEGSKRAGAEISGPDPVSRSIDRERSHRGVTAGGQRIRLIETRAVGVRPR